MSRKYVPFVNIIQGATIDTPYTIHEFDMMDKKLRYVALSRSTDKNNINVL